MNTFQLIVAIAFGLFFGDMLRALFGFILDLAGRESREKHEEELKEELRQKSRDLAELISGEIQKANPNLEATPLKDGKGVKVNGKENTSKRKRV